MKKLKMPVIFVGHGSPMSALSDNMYSEAWREFAENLIKPKAILVISAHWYIDETAVSDSLKPHQIYDFYGFPKELYEMKYPVSGSAKLAHQVAELLSPFTEIEINNDWGIDHGAWVPLMSFFPKADIPVVQLSVDLSKSADIHYRLGKALAPLREQGILIIGSGDIVHNLGIMKYEETITPYPWAENFEAKVLSCIEKGDQQSLINYSTLGSDAELSIPLPDHYLPLLYVLALQEKSDKIHYFINSIAHGSVSMTSFIMK